MTDPAAGAIPTQAPALPPELEARISAFEHAEPPGDFSLASWFWMILLGLAVPLVLLAIGWCA